MRVWLELLTDTKVLLNNTFLAGICDEICDYSLHCSKCKDLNDKERRYMNFNYRFDFLKDKELTRVEKHFFLKQGWRNHLFINLILIGQTLGK